jgi:hypothetical protein
MTRAGLQVNHVKLLTVPRKVRRRRRRYLIGAGSHQPSGPNSGRRTLHIQLRTDTDQIGCRRLQ